MKRFLLIFLIAFLTSNISAQTNQFAYLRIQVKDSSGENSVSNVKITLVKNDTSFVLNSHETQIKIKRSLWDTIIAKHPDLGTVKMGFNAKYGALKELKLILPRSCSAIPKLIVCPKCKSTKDAIPIIYGPVTKKQQKSVDKGKAKLGGNELSKCYPNNFCKKDNIEF
jgi:hypothetical protein